MGNCLSHHEDASKSTLTVDQLSLDQLVDMLRNGAPGNKILAAQRITEVTAQDQADNRHTLLRLRVLQPLLVMLADTGRPVCRVAATQPSTHLDSGSYPASSSTASTGSTFHSCIAFVVPQLRSLMTAAHPDAALSACQTLANLARSPVLVSQVLALIGPLRPAVTHIMAADGDPKTKQHFAQFLLNATLHAGTLTALEACGAVTALLCLLEDATRPSPAVSERCLCTLYNILRESPGKCAELALQPATVASLLHHLRPPSTPNAQRSCCRCRLGPPPATRPAPPPLHLPSPQLTHFTYGDVAAFLDAVLTSILALCSAVPLRDCSAVFRTLTQQVVSRLLPPAPAPPMMTPRGGAPGSGVPASSLAASTVGIPSHRKRAQQLSASIGMSTLGFVAGLGSAASRESVKQLPPQPPAIPEAALHLLRFLSARCEEGGEQTGLAECMLRLLQQDCNNLALLQVLRNMAIMQPSALLHQQDSVRLLLHAVDATRSSEVRQQGLAALISITRSHSTVACERIMQCGGDRIIVRLLQHGNETSASSTHGMQLSAWCAALLCQMYVSEVPCQDHIQDAVRGIMPLPLAPLSARSLPTPRMRRKQSTDAASLCPNSTTASPQKGLAPAAAEKSHAASPTKGRSMSAATATVVASAGVADGSQAPTRRGVRRSMPAIDAGSSQAAVLVQQRQRRQRRANQRAPPTVDEHAAQVAGREGDGEVAAVAEEPHTDVEDEQLGDEQAQAPMTPIACRSPPHSAHKRYSGSSAGPTAPALAVAAAAAAARPGAPVRTPVPDALSAARPNTRQPAHAHRDVGGALEAVLHGRNSRAGTGQGHTPSPTTNHRASATSVSISNLLAHVHRVSPMTPESRNVDTPVSVGSNLSSSQHHHNLGAAGRGSSSGPTPVLMQPLVLPPAGADLGKQQQESRYSSSSRTEEERSAGGSTAGSKSRQAGNDSAAHESGPQVHERSRRGDSNRGTGGEDDDVMTGSVVINMMESVFRPPGGGGGFKNAAARKSYPQLPAQLLTPSHTQRSASQPQPSSSGPQSSSQTDSTQGESSQQRQGESSSSGTAGSGGAGSSGAAAPLPPAGGAAAAAQRRRRKKRYAAAEAELQRQGGSSASPTAYEAYLEEVNNAKGLVLAEWSLEDEEAAGSDGEGQEVTSSLTYPPPTAAAATAHAAASRQPQGSAGTGSSSRHQVTDRAPQQLQQQQSGQHSNAVKAVKTGGKGGGVRPRELLHQLAEASEGGGDCWDESGAGEGGDGNWADAHGQATDREREEEGSGSDDGGGDPPNEQALHFLQELVQICDPSFLGGDGDGGVDDGR
ncbi:MAG: hypothetical protein WDW36_001352 [Sanguina aurantia]